MKIMKWNFFRVFIFFSTSQLFALLRMLSLALYRTSFFFVQLKKLFCCMSLVWVLTVCLCMQNKKNVFVLNVLRLIVELLLVFSLLFSGIFSAHFPFGMEGIWISLSVCLHVCKRNFSSVNVAGKFGFFVIDSGYFLDVQIARNFLEHVISVTGIPYIQWWGRLGIISSTAVRNLLCNTG